MYSMPVKRFAKIITFIILSLLPLYISAESLEQLYNKTAEEPPEETAEKIIKDDQNDEIDREIDSYFKNLQSTNIVDLDLKKLSELSEHDEVKKQHHEGAVVFNNSGTASFQHDFINHKVAKGDTLFNISKRYDMDPNKIILHNPELGKRPLYIGEEIIIVKSAEDKPVYKPIETYHRVGKGDSLWSISRKYGVSINSLCQWNGIRRNSPLNLNQAIKISKVALSSDFEYRSYFSWPLNGHITSGYGRRRNPFSRKSRQFHKGIDIGAIIGTPVHAAREGVVILSGRFRGYGNSVFIRHTNGYVSIYAHCKVNLVKKGDVVSRGQYIAQVGRTGMATGPHLHFEIRKETIPINPNYAMTLKEAISRKKVALRFSE